MTHQQLKIDQNIRLPTTNNCDFSTSTFILSLTEVHAPVCSDSCMSSAISVIPGLLCRFFLCQNQHTTLLLNSDHIVSNLSWLETQVKDVQNRMDILNLLTCATLNWFQWLRSHKLRKGDCPANTCKKGCIPFMLISQLSKNYHNISYEPWCQCVRMNCKIGILWKQTGGFPPDIQQYSLVIYVLKGTQLDN